MSADSPLTAPMGAAVIPYTNFRIALATAILGSLGATFGWINWLAIESGDWKLLVTIVVGAVVGLALHWTQHYVRVATSERNGESAAHAHTKRRLGALLYAGGFAFLGLATEHLIAEMVAEYLRPFLASLASLLPAGAIIGWSMNRGRGKDDNLVLLIADGVFVGWSIAVVSGIIWTISFGNAPWTALLSWWGLIGIGTRVLTGQERNAVKVGDPIAAVALVFALTFALNSLSARIPYDKLGPFKSMVLIVTSMAAEVQQSPGVPADSWIKAEQELAKTHGVVDTIPVGKPLPRTRTSVAEGLPGGTQIDVRRGMENLVKAWNDSTPPRDSTPPGGISLRAVARSPSFRSWLVIVLFALGAGFAPRVERALRPIDYPNSETYRNDILLTCFMSAMIVIACLVAHFGPKQPQGGKRASDNTQRTCGQYSICTGRTVLRERA